MTTLFLNPPLFTKANRIVNKECGGGFSKSGNPSNARKFAIVDFMYAYQIAVEAGYDAKLIEDLYNPANSPKEVIDRIDELEQYHHIFIRSSLPTFYNDILLAKAFKNELGDNVQLVVFGPAVGDNLSWFKQYPYFDVVVTSDIEAVILDLLAEITPSEIQGCFFKNGEEYVCDDPTKKRADLTKLPAYLPFHLPEFRDYDKVITFTRGCPVGCGYCPFPPTQGLKMRARSVTAVVDELEHLEKNLGATDVEFRDPNFNFKRRRVVELCEEIIRRKLTIKWYCEAILITLDDELIKLMSRANCYKVAFGVESLSTDVLKAVNRPVKLSDHLRLADRIKALKRHDIEPWGLFIIGMDQDTMANILHLPEYTHTVGMENAQFMAPNLYPGTAMYERGLSLGLISPEMQRDPDLFFDRVGHHDTIKQFSLSEHISEDQLMLAVFLTRAYHSHLHSNNSLKKVFRSWVIFALKKFLLHINNQQLLAFAGRCYKAHVLRINMTPAT